MKGKHLKLFLAALLTVVFIAFGTGVSLAYQTGNFQIKFELSSSPTWESSQNDGFPTADPASRQGMWFQYPQQEGAPWWNEWWYDDPYRKPGDKWIRLQFDWQQAIAGQPTDFSVTINWTNGLWDLVPDHEIAPPIGPGSEIFIERLTPWTFHFPESQPGHFDSEIYWLHLGYNPEWVSVDVRGQNVLISNGTLDHECVPEPATMTLLLLGFGLTGLAGLRRKFS